MKLNFCIWTLLAATAAGGIVVNGQPVFARDTDTNTLTLETAIQFALTNNPEFRMRAADIASARGEVVTARTWQNPEITIAPGFKQVRDPSDTQFHGEFGLEQTFEWPGKRALRRALAEKNVAARHLALEGFRSQLAVQVRRAWFTALAARQIVSLREQRLALARSFVDAARKKVEGGFAPEFEVTKAEVETVAAQKSLREAQADFDGAQIELNRLMGRDADEPMLLAGTLEKVPLAPVGHALVQRALLQNPAIQIQEAEVERAGLSLKSVRKSRLPDFAVGPSLEYSRDEQIVGFGVSLPLPLWDRKRGEIATATAEQQKALAELDKLRREIAGEVTISIRRLAAAQDALGFYTPALRERLKSALDAAEKGYSEGRTSLLLYLEAQRTYFDTQADRFETLQKLHEAQAALEAAVGVPLESLSHDELK